MVMAARSWAASQPTLPPGFPIATSKGNDMYVSTKPFHREQSQPAAQPTLIDNPFAPEVFATGFAGFTQVGGVLQVTLDSVRCDPSRPLAVMERAVVGRVTLPIETAQALVTALNAFLEQQGYSPSKAISGNALFQ